VKGFPHGLRALAGEAVPVAAIALLVWLGLRAFVCERYVVPSESMQPTLYGDPEHGDIVVVDKLASVRSLRRHDLIVLKNPDAPEHHIVKRIAALGDDKDHCWVDLRDGDLWLGPDKSRLARDVKDPVACRDLRIPWFEWPPKGKAEEITHFLVLGTGQVQAGVLHLAALSESESKVLEQLRPEARRRQLDDEPPCLLPPGFAGLARPVDTSYLDGYGNRGRESGVLVNDFGADLQFDRDEGVQSLVCVFEQRFDAYAWIWRAGRLQFWRGGELVEERRVDGPPRHGRLEFGFLDGRFFFVPDGRDAEEWCIARRPAWVQPDAGPISHPPPKSLLACQGLGQGSWQIRHLLVFRDLWQFRERMLVEDPVTEVPPGQVYLLGDNSFDSEDSRKHGPYSLRNFVGVPLMVIGPWPRFRWLGR
jgi:Signal peptidase, peptidase S26